MIVHTWADQLSYDSVYMGRSTSITAYDGTIWYFATTLQALCILTSLFLLTITLLIAFTLGGYQISIAYCLFFILSKWCKGNSKRWRPWSQTAPVGSVWSGSALFAHTYLSENLGSLRLLLVQILWCLDSWNEPSGKNLLSGCHMKENRSWCHKMHFELCIDIKFHYLCRYQWSAVFLVCWMLLGWFTASLDTTTPPREWHHSSLRLVQ